MANIYLKKEGLHWGLCNDKVEMFDNQYCTKAVIEHEAGALPRLHMTFIMPETLEHLCSKFVTLETQKEPVPKKDPK